MIAKACTRCGRIGCTEHRPKPWEGSTRHRKVKSGWSQQRRNKGVMALHRGICHVCNRPGAEEVDHVVPLSQGGSDLAHNLRPIHRDCHRRKTLAEARAGRGG